LPTIIFLLTLNVFRKRKCARRSFSWIWEYNNKTVCSYSCLCHQQHKS